MVLSARTLGGARVEQGAGHAHVHFDVFHRKTRGARMSGDRVSVEIAHGTRGEVAARKRDESDSGWLPKLVGAQVNARSSEYRGELLG